MESDSLSNTESEVTAMTLPIDESAAQDALRSIAQRRHEVVAEIDVPRWYWPGMAGGWLGLGLIADYGPPWVSTVATLAFGAAHASIAPRVLSGRRASSRLAIHDDVATRRIPALIIGLLIAMAGVTVGFALWLHADGARHPATWASVIVAALLLAAGPALMGAIRRRADRVA
jgi:hypothetical protein